MSDVEWFSFVDIDGARTVAGNFGDDDGGGTLLFRPGQPVLFTDDPVASETPPYRPYLVSDLCAYSLRDAEIQGRALAERARRPYETERGETGKEGSDARDRARAWMLAQPASVAGHGGDRELARVAVTLVRGFRLAPLTDAMRILEEYNAKAEPPWPASKLERVATWAEKEGRMPFGAMLDQPRLRSRFSSRGRGPGRGGA